jgi:class 3 adenylate cyclase/tetratricopeptide (TPR) repeat protein
MPVCAHCGEENPERARFCLSCGKPVAPPGPSLEVRKTVTVLFCDVSGSTRLGERHDPEQLRRLMSRYYDLARGVLERHGGTVEKFIGDAVVGVFGVPVLHEDDALRSLRAAVELRESIAELNVELEAVYGTRIDVRIGVNSGEVVAGDALSGHGYASGDAVNVAQRLEAGAAAGEILIGDTTRRLARDAIRTEAAGPRALKGRDEPVIAHRLLEVLPGLPSHARRFDSPMVGRERELRLLEDAFERVVKEKSCHLFTVLGQAGVGKSRLVREGLARIGVGARVLIGRCLPYGEGITFWPALEVVKQATGIVDEDSSQQALAKIAALLSGDDREEVATARVAALVGLAEGGVAAEEGFWGFRKLLEACTREQPLVAVFDDVNWGEPTFLDLVDYLTDWIHEAPVLLVCVARPDLLEKRPLWGGGKRNSTSIFLEPLSESESAELLENLLGAEIAGNVSTRIHGAAEGNPLFVEEMVSMLIEGDFLRRDGPGSVSAELDRVPVPESIQVLLASRLDQLSPGERRAIERGAVEGAVFHRGAVDALADETLREELDNCLAALVRKELIRPFRASFAGEDAFRFRHVLIRDAAYDALPKQLRAELHERFAQWLEEVAGDRVAELEELVGYHLEQSYRHRLEVMQPDEHGSAVALRGGVRLASAGRRALAKGDTPAAVNLMERAAALLAGDPTTLLAVLPDLGVALRDAGAYSRSEAVFSDAAAAARRAGDGVTELRVTVERSLARLMRDPGAADAVFAELDATMPELESLDDDRTLAVAWTLIGLRRGIWPGRFADGERALDRALVHARRSGDRRQEAEILRHLALAATWGPRSVPEAIDRCRGILDSAAGDPFVEAGTLRYLAVLEARLGNFDQGRAAAARARSVFEELGVSGHLPISIALAVADIELLAGNYAEAERELRAGLERLDRIGERGYRSTAAAYLAEALYRQGRFGEAEDMALRAEEAAAPGDIWTQSIAQGTRAKVLAQRSDAGAEALAREAVDSLEQTDGFDLRGTAWLNLGEVLDLEGRGEAAREAAQVALDIFEQEQNIVAGGRARELVERVGTGIILSEGRGGSAS